MSSCWLKSPVSLLLTLLLQVNYQYRHGTSFPVALRTIYADGGIPRFYRVVIPALAQGPLSRFGDTAANTGMLTLLDSFEVTKDLNRASVHSPPLRFLSVTWYSFKGNVGHVQHISWFN